MKYILIVVIILFTSFVRAQQVQVQVVFNNTIDIDTFADTIREIKGINLSDLKKSLKNNERISDKNLNIRVALFDLWAIGDFQLTTKHELTPNDYISTWKERTKKKSEVLFLFVKDDEKAYKLYAMSISEQLEKEYEFPINFINGQLKGSCVAIVEKGIRQLAQSMTPLWVLIAKLEGDEELTRAEANKIRDEYIEKIEDTEKKAEAYFKLQEKVTLIDPANFRDIPIVKNNGDILQCIDAVDVIMERHYQELGKTYDRSAESWSLATQDATHIYIHKECYDKAIVRLNEELGKGVPVMVGVDWKPDGANYDKITDHWVVITARRQDTKGIYYTYMEVAHRETDTRTENSERGTSTDHNRFYFDAIGNYLIGHEPTVNQQSGILPIVTIIRIIADDNCCNRISYLDEKLNPAENANRINKDNARGTFHIIRQNKQYKKF